MKIRSRFAPSPTGFMHIGNLKTALYAYLIAKHENGSFILRIEDTDKDRFVEGATEVILNTLKETGLIHDEGPDIGGDYGPYTQSERKSIYMEYAKKLIEKNEAYYCFCSKERIDMLKTNAENVKESYRYDKKCFFLSKEEIEENLKTGVPFVIRQNNPSEGTTVFDDIIYGKISVDNSELDDMILIKSDGYPTYNFANVVDDHLMDITHVIRGQEYLSSAPKYNRLYEAFGWEVPIYIHCSHIMKDAQNKLSKRHGSASYDDLRAKGYLKDSILNYIALLGWSSGTNEEIFTLEELIKIFDYKKINKSPAIFDEQKLKWINGEYIKKLTLEEFNTLAIPYYKETLKKEYDFLKLSSLLQSRCEVFSDIRERIDFLDELPEYSNELFIHKKMKTTKENSLTSLEYILPRLKNLNNWNKISIDDTLEMLISELNVKSSIVFWSLRTALSGKQSTPGGAADIAELLGKNESIKRIEKGIETLR